MNDQPAVLIYRIQGKRSIHFRVILMKSSDTVPELFYCVYFLCGCISHVLYTKTQIVVVIVVTGVENDDRLKQTLNGSFVSVVCLETKQGKRLYRRGRRLGK